MVLKFTFNCWGQNLKSIIFMNFLRRILLHSNFLCIRHVMHKLRWTSENVSRLVVVIATLLFNSFMEKDHYEYLIYFNVKIFCAHTKFHGDKIFCGPFFLIYIQTISIELKKVWKERYKIKRLHFHFFGT